MKTACRAFTLMFLILFSSTSRSFLFHFPSIYFFSFHLFGIAIIEAESYMLRFGDGAAGPKAFVLQKNTAQLALQHLYCKRIQRSWPYSICTSCNRTRRSWPYSICTSCNRTRRSWPYSICTSCNRTRRSWPYSICTAKEYSAAGLTAFVLHVTERGAAGLTAFVLQKNTAQLALQHLYFM